MKLFKCWKKINLRKYLVEIVEMLKKKINLRKYLVEIVEMLKRIWFHTIRPLGCTVYERQWKFKPQIVQVIGRGPDDFPTTSALSLNMHSYFAEIRSAICFAKNRPTHCESIHSRFGLEIWCGQSKLREQ